MRSDAESLFDRPARWRAEAARSLGLSGTALAAAVSPGPAYPSVLRTIERALPADVSLIVDVGAGLGGASAWLAEVTGAEVVAVEPADGSRSSARELFPSLAVVEGSVADVPLPSGCADAVTALNVISLLEGLEPMLVEAARLLRAGGVLAIADLFLPDGDEVAASPNTFRSQQRVIELIAAHGFSATEAALGDPAPSTRWSRVASAVDARVRALHRGRELRRWRADQRHLQRSIRNLGLLGGCIVATAPTR